MIVKNVILGTKFIHTKRKIMSKEKGRQWDGHSRPPTDLYKKNFDEIFGKKEEDEKENKEEEKKNDE
jgi:hypothetical protein